MHCLFTEVWDCISGSDLPKFTSLDFHKHILPSKCIDSLWNSRMRPKYPTTARKPVNGGTDGISLSRSWVVRTAGLFLQHHRIGAGIAYRDISKSTVGTWLAPCRWLLMDVSPRRPLGKQAFPYCCWDELDLSSRATLGTTLALASHLLGLQMGSIIPGFPLHFICVCILGGDKLMEISEQLCSMDSWDWTQAIRFAQLVFYLLRPLTSPLNIL